MRNKDIQRQEPEVLQNKTPGMTPVQSLAELEAIMGHMRSGPVDSESDQIKTIRDALISGKITPEEAISRAREIEASRSSHYR